MKKLLYILFLVLYSCNSNSQTDTNKQTKFNDLKIDSGIIENIVELTNKNAEKNSVIRYKASDSINRVFESYDSLVPGVRFKFVNEKTAYQIIDIHFDNVKKSKNYLFLTNLDFDDSYKSYYDIVIAPISDQFDLIKFIGTEPVNYDLSNQDVVEWFRKKNTEFDFDIIVADFDRIETIIKSEPKSYEKLGNEIYEFCPDVIDQGHSDMNELIQHLKKNKHMWFWWD
ncbi:DUF4253 domain-containing protein [Winogradskyella maritima]|uniref:DUF4253 domain-containing protein n=1 Tax=Winogradskyella maritima TaxID=1517766 RepID=A0ABV8ALC8_9FLAO|nr:DUF4253 domain-containing protein [Winogradskyella maritima]MDO1502559.1 DUF4253 domain-containing protein [Winogradskyella maritima]